MSNSIPTFRDKHQIFLSSFTECVDFTDSLEIPVSAEYVHVKCNHAKEPEKQPLYQDGYFLVQEKEAVKERFAKFEAMYNGTRAPSVLILGIDSVGRVNMQRAMPQVFKFLKEGDRFVDMMGFNKVGENTYPNLLPSFAGVNESVFDCLEDKWVANCPLVWWDYQKSGYATAYSEDYVAYGTFNYAKKGFKDPPTDYYSRPGYQMLEKNVQKPNDPLCAGHRHMCEYALTQGLDFAEFYKGQPFFGIFWTNKLTHDNVRDFLTMDDVLLDTLQDAEKRGIFDDAIVVVMGDHGFRMGSVWPNLPGGFYDNMLPVMYISLPKWYKEKFPEDVKGLEANQNRLTTHYDFHLTLQQFIQRGGRTSDPVKTYCNECQPLIRPVPQDRNCMAVGVPSKFCACNKD